MKWKYLCFVTKEAEICSFVSDFLNTHGLKRGSGFCSVSGRKHVLNRAPGGFNQCIVIWDGYPLEIKADVKATFINGRQVWPKEDSVKN